MSFGADDKSSAYQMLHMRVCFKGPLLSQYNRFHSVMKLQLCTFEVYRNPDHPH